MTDPGTSQVACIRHSPCQYNQARGTTVSHCPLQPSWGLHTALPASSGYQNFFICHRVHLSLGFLYLHAYMYVCVHFVYMGLKKHNSIKLAKLTNTLTDSVRNVTCPTNTLIMCALCKPFSENLAWDSRQANNYTSLYMKYLGPFLQGI